ncbi:dihydrofolate reductase family protein [Pyxidicoccus sp. 3LFB2]
MKHGLIDEYRLLIHPVVIGSGLRLFPEQAQPLNLRLVSSTRFAKGAVANVYRPE